jgi:hypothetical protein
MRVIYLTLFLFGGTFPIERRERASDTTLPANTSHVFCCELSIALTDRMNSNFRLLVTPYQAP